MKKILFLFLTLGFLVSCTDTKNDDSKAIITVLGESATSLTSMMEFEKEYETEHPNIDLEFKPNSFDDAFNKANQDFANRTGLYDVVMQYNFSLSSFVENDYVQNIGDLLKDVPAERKAFETDLFQNAWQEVGFYEKNGKVIKVGYPFASNTMFIAYNKEMFEDEAQKAAYKAKYKEDLVVPITWEQFYNVAEFFTQKEKDTYGICMQGASGGWLYYEWVNFLFGMDGKVMDKKHGWEGDENTPILLNTPEAKKALEFYKSLKPFNAGNFTNIDAYEQIKVMQDKKVAMGIIWSDLAYSMIDKGDGKFDERFSFAPIPGNKSLLAGGSYFINKNSKNPDAALEYIIDLIQPEMQVALAKKGLCTASKKAYEDEDVKKIPYSNAMKNSLERGVYMLEAGIDATMISDKITTYVQRYWNDELSSEEALKKMQGEIEAEREILFESLKSIQ